ncbi:hypothetical protein [Erysipelothrix tonsillarum]|uniref:hypothetical protein n=1 Tax=Erysipelothrix tonsillarum TaxID=38402 RepID=UPI0039E0B29D
MINQRFQALNGQALKRLIVPLDIPAPNLGIDFAAVHQGIDFDYFPPAQKAPVILQPSTIEGSNLITGSGNPVTASMFPNYGYFGDPLGDTGGGY